MISKYADAKTTAGVRSGLLVWSSSRLPYVLLLIVFVMSRAVYYSLGVRFDARGINTFFQITDPELLRHRLLESIYYLHVQPPGFNLYVGIILKLFPSHYAAAFHVLHLIYGAAICCLLYHLMRVNGVRALIAFALSALFIVSPGVVLFENFVLYEYLLLFLLLVTATMVYCFFARERIIYALLFFFSLFLLVLLRNHFHLIYLLASFGLLLGFGKHHRKAILLAGILPILLTLSLYFKNWMLFGSFSSSTWLGMNMDTITSHQLSPEEARHLVDSGLISPVSLIDSGESLSKFKRFITMPSKIGIPVLDEESTSTGVPNFNNLAYFQVQKYYIRDGFALLRHYPQAYVRSLEAAWFTYFLPTGDFPFFDQNRPKIWPIDRFFNVVFFGQWIEAPNRKALRAIAANGRKLSLVLYTGTFLIIGLPLLWAWGIFFLISGARRGSLDVATVILLGFLLFNITYLSAIANFLSCFENNRYRFQVDGFYLILLGIAVEQTWRRFAAGCISKQAVGSLS